MSKIINIDLPFFMGFYESVYENGDTEYCAINEEMDYLRADCGETHEYDDFDFDYQRRRDDIVEQFIEAFYQYAPDFVLKVEKEALVSPKYYNYETDRIYANITLSDGWENKVKEFINANREKLEEKIQKDWTSYDGFLSFIDNHLNDFEKHLFDENDKEQSMYIGIMLGYMMDMDYRDDYTNKEDGVAWAIAMDVMEEIYDGDYVFLKADKEVE